MNSYYESFLRKDIFPNNPEKADIVCEVYEMSKEAHYINLVIEDFIHGASSYETRRRLERNVIEPFKLVQKKEAERTQMFKDILEDDKR